MRLAPPFCGTSTANVMVRLDAASSVCNVTVLIEGKDVSSEELISSVDVVLLNVKPIRSGVLLIWSCVPL